MMVVSAMLVAGAFIAFVAIRLLASRTALAAARSLELLLEQGDGLRHSPGETPHWTRGASLSWRQIYEDVESLRRLIQRRSRRAAETLAELDEARRDAEEQNEQKAQFFAKIGHELRAPLNTIIGYATLLNEDAAEAGQEAAATDLERIIAAGRRLSMTINDMLGSAKIVSGSSALERKVINVRSLAEEVVSKQHIHLHKEVRVTLKVDSDIEIIIGDPEKLRHCLLNLLASASESDREEVRLSITQIQHGGVPSACFSVEAVGVGRMGNDAVLPRSRSEHERPANYADGSLRLAVARRLAKLMGGECIVDETGSTKSLFRLILPLTQEKGEQRSVSADEPHSGKEDQRARRASALIIDDDDSALDLMRRWLGQMGYNVLVAVDGEAGLKLARAERPDLILLDGFLPGRSGYEILSELRADPLIGRTPVIFVTVDDDRCRGIQCGASDYLRKPLTQDSLRAVLDVYKENSTGEILIIDDDEDAAELIRRSAEEVGFSTRRATNGLEGLAMVSAERPAAIVLDVRMPLMDGFSVIDQLARTDDLNDIPIVVVSGQDMNVAEHRRLAAAAHRVFTKGMVSPRQIAQSLQEVVA